MNAGSNNINKRTQTTALVRQLKKDGQDFEFYPTTHEIINAVLDDLSENFCLRNRRYFNVLDVGAGDCRFTAELNKRSETAKKQAKHNSDMSYDMLEFFDETMVIEKALAHIQNLKNVPNTVLVGTDFFDVDLSVIQADVTFVNPPYSAYELWMTQIINTATTPVIYAVIPRRWQTNNTIKTALTERNMIAHVIMQADFNQADRQARATVDVVRIMHKDVAINKELAKAYYHGKPYAIGGNSLKTPLERFLSDFDEAQELDDTPSFTCNQLQTALHTENLDGLVERYNNERIALQKDLQAIVQVSPHLFKMFDVDAKTIIEKVQSDLKHLKQKYWNVFFDIYEPIKKRLTSASIERFKNKIFITYENMDFTYSNAQAVTLLAINEANYYIDEQIKELFDDHANVDNLSCYKSNQRVLEKNDWRYKKPSHEQYHHTKLEYRLVLSGGGDYAFSTRYTNIPFYQKVINDYVVVARTLGLDIGEYSMTTNQGDVDFGRNIVVRDIKTGFILLDIKFYKKGTYHVRLNQDFCLRLNVAIGKLYGWLYSEDDIGEIDATADKNVWHTLTYITPKALQLGFNSNADVLDADNEEVHQVA